MNDGREQLRARARLMLMAERAFGVDALRVAPVIVEPQAVEVPQQHPQAVRLDPVLPPPSAPGANLFGVTKTAAPAPPPMPISEPFTSPLLAPGEKSLRLAEMDANEVRGCTKCRLSQTRSNTVFGEGSPDARLVFVGEGPGETEDRTGRPFVGRAGEKLTQMIAGMGLTREQVFIANIVKCRPPGNREPAPDEVATCTPYLERQLEIIRPRVIVTLGRPALQFMIGQKVSISRMRGQWLSWRGVKLMPTFHPAYILRNYTRETRAAVWSDLQQVMTELGLSPPKKNSAQEV